MEKVNDNSYKNFESIEIVIKVFKIVLIVLKKVLIVVIKVLKASQPLKVLNALNVYVPLKVEMLRFNNSAFTSKKLRKSINKLK